MLLSQCNFIPLHLVPIKPLLCSPGQQLQASNEDSAGTTPKCKSFLYETFLWRGKLVGHFGKIPHPLTHGPSTPPENCPTIIIFKIETVHTKV